MPSTTDDLMRTRAAFETWRASQPGRRRIPEHLWQMALALLQQYSVSRVCRELGLSCQQLRLRLTNSASSANPKLQQAAHFLQVCVADLATSDRAIFGANSDNRHQVIEANLQMIYERRDGSRLTLRLPSSDWDRIAALCQSFMQG